MWKESLPWTIEAKSASKLQKCKRGNLIQLQTLHYTLKYMLYTLQCVQNYMIYFRIFITFSTPHYITCWHTISKMQGHTISRWHRLESQKVQTRTADPLLFNSKSCSWSDVGHSLLEQWYGLQAHLLLKGWWITKGRRHHSGDFTTTHTIILSK